VVGGRYITIQVGTLRHVAWNSQIKSVHRAGAATLLEEVK
jgi:hypothetical protein